MKYNGKNIMSFYMKGDSAFDIYKKYHPEYTGTEEEWLEILKGDFDIKTVVGDINTALDSIIAIQESLIGGDS
jgi:hypothetical protein